MVGKRFGKLVALCPTEKRINNHVVWKCRCDCGNEHYVIASVLKSGVSNSCGCWRRDRLMKHGGKGTRLYHTWKNIRRRCFNINNPKWHRYGGRSIEFFKDWNDFSVFRNWAFDNGYSDGLQIDRINNNGPYSPSNCQWLSFKDHSIKSHIDTPCSLRLRKRDKKGKLIKNG